MFLVTHLVNYLSLVSLCECKYHKKTNNCPYLQVGTWTHYVNTVLKKKKHNKK